MAKLSIAYGVIFILMGLYSYFGISSESVTALIPAFFGVPMLILGWLGLNEKYLKHAMHGAAVLTLLGFAGTAGGLIKFFENARRCRTRKTCRSYRTSNNGCFVFGIFNFSS